VCVEDDITPHRITVQERIQKLYDEAVIIFEATLQPGQKMTGAQRVITLWNDAEQTAMEQQLSL
jgi:hypothetical protein